MIKLYNNDCIKVLDAMIEKGLKVDTIITDIPYGLTQNKIDIFPSEEFFEKIWKVTDVFVTTSQGKAMIKILNALPKKIKWYDIIWNKVMTSGFLNAKRQPLRKHETILVMYKKQPTYNPQMWESGKPIHSSHGFKEHNKNNNYGKIKHDYKKTRAGKTDRYPTSILEIKKPHPSITKHPTQKPIELMVWLIKTYTNENDVVFDPFMGSGTTGVACKNTGRSFIGVELDKGYFEIAKERIEGE